MDELLLIDMMSELNPELLQDDYIEKDMRKGKIPLVNIFFSFRKPTKLRYEHFFEHPISEEIPQYTKNKNDIEVKRDFENVEIMNDVEISEEIGIIKNVDDNNIPKDENTNNQNFNISIYTREYPNRIKIISGVTAASLVVSGIVLFVIRHHKGIIKLVEKKAQIIY